MNTALGTGDTPLSPGFIAWREMCAKNPEFDVGRLLARGNPHLSPQECAAYDAPFPDRGHRAALRAFPPMVPEFPGSDGAPVSRQAREFWRNDWQGRSFMAIGAQDPVLGVPVMNALRAQIRGCPEPLVLPQARALRAGARRGSGAQGGGILPRLMSHIYIYSPSSAVRDKAAVRRGIARLKALGHEVELDPALFATHMRFAGDDDTRLAAIGRAAASGADIALITRGGYGLTRLLPRLPYKAIAKSVSKGTRWVGLSDFTALQCAVLAETGAVTWAGPAVGEDFGPDGEPDDIMQACFEDLASGQGEGAGWQLPAAERVESLRPSRACCGAATWRSWPRWPARRWLPRVKGGILFLEDVHEHPYRVERMLTQLLYAGVLGEQKAIVLRSFHQLQTGSARQGLQAQDRGRVAAHAGAGTGVHGPAVRPCAHQGGVAGRRRSAPGRGRPRRLPALGASALSAQGSGSARRRRIQRNAPAALMRARGAGPA